jgi:hypothetical protein
MSCLTDYIGIRFTDAPVPESGLYINSLPGISTEFIDKVADCEQGDYLGMWSDVQDRSYLLFKNKIISMMAQKAKFEQEIYQTKRFSASGSSIELIPSSNEYRGCFVRLPESKYSTLFIKNILVYSDAIVSTTLKVYDTQDAEELYTQDIDLVAGVNVVTVNQSFAQKYGVVEIFIGVDCSSVNTMKTTQPQFYYFYNGKNYNICEGIPEIREST